jgi:hypothetical protein
MTLPTGVHLADASDAYYYDFTPCAGWRCIVLDAFDLAVHDGRTAGKFHAQMRNCSTYRRSLRALIKLARTDCIPGSAQSAAACCMIRAHNPNPSASDKSLRGDFQVGMTPGAAPSVDTQSCVAVRSVPCSCRFLRPPVSLHAIQWRCW